MIQPERCTVPPRVYSFRAESVIPLVDEIELLLQKGQTKRILLAGEGTKAAVAHLAALMGDRVTGQQLYLDDGGPMAAIEGSPFVFVHAVERPLASPGPFEMETLTLAPWERDDVIEFLLTKYPEHCPSVMSRLKDDDFGFAEGSPGVWQLILDRMVANDSLTDIRQIVWDEVNLRINDSELADAIADHWLFPSNSELLGERKEEAAAFCDKSTHPARELLENKSVKQLFVDCRLIHRFRHDADVSELIKVRMSSDFISRLASVAAAESEVREKIESVFSLNETLCTPIAAMVLSRADSSWRPRGEDLWLFQADFTGVEWQDIKLLRANLIGTRFRWANLAGANFGKSRFARSDFTGADLTEACFEPEDIKDIRRMAAKARARMRRRARRKKRKSKMRARPHTQFHRVVFQGADLTESWLVGCYFNGADFREAQLVKTNASSTTFNGGLFEQADFSKGRFDGAMFRDLDLSRCTIDRARFVSAAFQKVNLVGLVASSVDFSHAKMKNLIWTDSVLKQCDFQNANLSRSRMGEVRWEYCDLRSADLRDCVFHMGSSRSGLVGSPYPSHGTRTGFYTDDYNDQHFQPPEVIRKASLYGCDLRGAKIDGVDFYLVDLRKAKFDDEQRDQLIATGAILDEDVRK